MATRTKTTAARKPAAASTTRKTPAAAKALAPSRAPADAGKSASARAASAQPSSAPSAPDEAPPVVTERARRGDLLDAMDERSPLRRADLKVVMELMLEEMGKMVDAGDELVLPPLGKLTVKKRVERAGGDMLTVKLKRLPDTGVRGDTDP